MKGATSIQERLWELRKDKGLNLEELSELTGISKSALGSYEKEDYKEINHGNLITLADFYGVSVDYLLCRTENREQINTSLTELHLNDEMVALLKSGRINNRLLCELATCQTWFGGYYVQSGAGSGVIISQDGYILTCAHVVSGATSVKVQLDGSDESYDATIVGQDSTSDIAVLKIDATGLTPAVIGDSDALAVGEVAVAVGNPLGTLSNTVTDGIVSALNRQVTVQNNDMTLIQTDASISPGNSGGGLFNANGELIGIVNAKSSSSDAEGLGFAIPINTAMEMAKQMIEKGYVARPAMGVTVITINDAQTAMQYGVSNYGVYIYQIASGSGAEKGGLKLGDRIISIDDVAVSSASDVQKYCQSKEVDDTVTLQVERDGKVISCEVTLGESTQSTATAESGN